MSEQLKNTGTTQTLINLNNKILVSSEDFTIAETAKIMAENDPRNSVDTSMAVADSYKRIAVYARFFVMKLNLGMLVPCINGKVVLEPQQKYKGGGNAFGTTGGAYTKEYAQYLKAKEKVIFHRWKLSNAKYAMTKCETVRDLYNEWGHLSLTVPLNELHNKVIL